MRLRYKLDAKLIGKKIVFIVKVKLILWVTVKDNWMTGKDMIFPNEIEAAHFIDELKAKKWNLIS